MTQQLSFVTENLRRVKAVEKSFGPTGAHLVDPDRVLMGEGRLMKQSRHGPQPKAFFLFNDILVYGSIVINGHWFNAQNIIALEDIELEDMESGFQMKHQWLIRTPRKSFFVSAASREEKQAWMEHIEDCKTQLLHSSGRRASSTFAVTWIPDPASAICMRCSKKFTVTHRRHHCRKCGFLVCRSCSKNQAVIGHIHPTKRLRVCTNCHSSITEKEEENRVRGNSSGLRSDEDETYSCEEEEEKMEDHYDDIEWMDSRMDSFSPYVYFKPEHVWPPLNSHS